MNSILNSIIFYFVFGITLASYSCVRVNGDRVKPPSLPPYQVIHLLLIKILNIHKCLTIQYQ